MISVIVPVYNVEKYLNRCVDSIINQTYTDLEIILVDDGSTDSSGSICDEYAKKDERIKVIHKENGGLSDARNAGVTAATGDYISFIDSDDYIELNMMELLITTIGDCDMATCGAFNDYASGSTPQYTGDDLSFETDNENAFVIMLEAKLTSVSVWNKLIKTDIAKKIQFPKGRLTEDVFYMNKLIPIISTVHFNTKPVYHYVHRMGSIMTAPFVSQNMDVIYAYEETQTLISFFPSIKQAANFRLLWAYFVVLDRMLLLDNYKDIPEYNSVLAYLKKNAFNVMKNPLFRKSRRIAALALKISVKLYRVLLIKNENKNNRLFS